MLPKSYFFSCFGRGGGDIMAGIRILKKWYAGSLVDKARLVQLDPEGLMPDMLKKVNDLQIELTRVTKTVNDLQVEIGTEKSALFSTPGNWTFNVPSGVQTVTVTVQGAGGSGAGLWERHGDWGAGAGGGSGAYAQAIIAVTPYSGIPLVVGAGGASVSGNAVGIAGGASSFGSYITCTGGGGGGGGRGPSSAVAGTAGVVSVLQNVIQVLANVNGNPGVGNGTRNDSNPKPGGASPTGSAYGAGGTGVANGQISGAGGNGYVLIQWA